jgi:hypothetical protein
MFPSNIRDAMQIASRFGSLEMLQVLHRHGGDLWSKGPKGESLYHLAASNGHIDVMEWLEAQGINVRKVDFYGQTVIHIAARRGEAAVLRYLLDTSKIPLDVFEQEDFDGRKPVQCIPRRGLDYQDIQGCKDVFELVRCELEELQERQIIYAPVAGIDF